MTASLTPMHGTKGDVKARESKLGLTRSPRKPTRVGNSRWLILPTWASLPHVATPWRQDAWESEGTKWQSASRGFPLEVFGVGCCAPALVWPS